MKGELIKMLLEKSFRYSPDKPFTLVSKRKSAYYINCRPVSLHPRGMLLIGSLVFDAVCDLDIGGIGGLTFGADPIAVSAAFVSELRGRCIKAFSIRKELKNHGVIKWIEGDLDQGTRVAVIDDVATTGGSTLKAVERARTMGLEVVRAVILVDRQEGGMENIRREVPDAKAIITRDELMEHRRILYGA